MTMTYTLHPWTPDRKGLNISGARILENLQSTKYGFTSLPKLKNITAPCPLPLDDKSHIYHDNFCIYQPSLNQDIIFLGHIGGIEMHYQGIWKNTYQTSYKDASLKWQFEIWDRFIMATNGKDPILYFDFDEMTFLSFIKSSQPPLAHYLKASSHFLILGHHTNSEYGERMISWSQMNNPQDFTFDETSQSDHQLLDRESGAIQAIVGDNIIYIVTQNALWQMQYVGSPYIWRFEKRANAVGTSAPQSVIHHHGKIFYYTKRGFVMFDGQSLKAIGKNQIDDFFIKDCDPHYINNIQASLDLQNGNIGWLYTPKQGEKKLLLYNVYSGHWGIAKEHYLAITENNQEYFTFITNDLTIATASPDPLLASLTTHIFAPTGQRPCEIKNILFPQAGAFSPIVAPYKKDNMLKKISSQKVTSNRDGHFPCRLQGTYFDITIATHSKIDELQSLQLDLVSS